MRVATPEAYSAFNKESSVVERIGADQPPHITGNDERRGSFGEELGEKRAFYREKSMKV